MAQCGRAYFTLLLIATFGTSLKTASAQDMPAEYQAVLKTLDRQGDYKTDVLKVNIPRNDVAVRVDGVATPTALGFGGWLAMTKGTNGSKRAINNPSQRLPVSRVINRATRNATAM